MLYCSSAVASSKYLQYFSYITNCCITDSAHTPTTFLAFFFFRFCFRYIRNGRLTALLLLLVGNVTWSTKKTRLNLPTNKLSIVTKHSTYYEPQIRFAPSSQPNSNLNPYWNSCQRNLLSSWPFDIYSWTHLSEHLLKFPTMHGVCVGIVGIIVVIVDINK